MFIKINLVTTLITRFLIRRILIYRIDLVISMLISLIADLFTDLPFKTKLYLCLFCYSHLLIQALYSCYSHIYKHHDIMTCFHFHLYNLLYKMNEYIAFTFYTLNGHETELLFKLWYLRIYIMQNYYI